MSASYWRQLMPAAPMLRHSDGMVHAEIAGRSVLFPSEADARFFVAAYTELPAIEGANESLRRWIDEKAFHEAQSQVRALTTEVEALRLKQAVLEERLEQEAAKAAKAARRAKVLAIALKNGITPE